MESVVGSAPLTAVRASAARASGVGDLTAAGQHHSDESESQPAQGDGREALDELIVPMRPLQWSRAAAVDESVRYIHLRLCIASRVSYTVEGVCL